MNEAIIDFKREMRKESRPGMDRFSMSSKLFGESPALREEEVSRAMRRRSANINLQKSIALLDEAVGTPGPLLRSARKTPSMRRNVLTTTPRLGSSFSRLDASLSAPLLTPSTSVASNFGDSTVPGLESMTSVTTPYRTTSRLNLTGVTDILEDVTTTNVALLLEEDPGLAASTSLFGDFLTSVKSYPSEHQVFLLLQQYEELLGEQVMLLRKLIRRAAPGQSKFARVREMLTSLQQEKCTWRLILALYKDRLETELQDSHEQMIESSNKKPSDKQIVNALYTREASVRQAQLVIDWLEKNAEEELDDHYNRVEFFTDKGVAWENTLHRLQQQREGIPIPADRPCVQELDPDAPIRGNRTLDDLDQEDESRLLKELFACIRAGQLDKAQQLCVRCGQPWRAATLEGWRLYHDNNFELDSDCTTVEPVEGNPHRDIWKMVCWRVAEDERLPQIEQAIYATLSGNLKKMLPVLYTWEDQLWGYCKAMVDTRVEQEIRINTTASRTLEELPPAYWNKVMSLDSIFKELQASPSDAVRAESGDRFHVIQKYIILGDIDGLMEEMYEWIKDETTQLPPHLIRFMAHLVLFFRTLALSTKEMLCVTVLEIYVRYLIEDKQIALIASYVAKLPQNWQVEWYARFLEGIHSTEERKKCLSYAEEADLDIPSITKLVVEIIRNKDRTEMSMEMDVPIDSAVSEEDRQKIEAIDWLVFDPSQRAEAIRQANAVMRTFLALKKHSAAREVFNKIPPGSIDVVFKAGQMQTGSTELCAEDDNAIREYLCVQAYLDAQDSFNDWFEHYHNAKPAKPDIPAGANFTERVAFEHKEKQYQSELERWNHTLLMQTETTENKIYNVLLFVDGGWMVDQRKDGIADEQRTHQMMLLRQMCLPSMCFLLQTVLHTTGQYKKSLQLGDTIGSEQHRLYTVFNKDELQRFLQRLRESAVSLLDQNLDPLGYKM